MLDTSQLRLIFVLLAIGIIIEKAVRLLIFIKSLKNEKELKAIMANGIHKNTSIVDMLMFEAIIILISLIVYHWNFSKAIQSPIVVVNLTVPVINFFVGSILYYIKIAYLNKLLHKV